MTLFVVRVSMFTFLPVLLAVIAILLDQKSLDRGMRLELGLMFLLGIGVAGNGIGSFVGHAFFADQVASAIGWPTGSPFQTEMAFANLALGILGIVAVGRRDGYLEATVTAVTVVAIGATLVHFIDMFSNGNFAPGNTIQNIANIVRPALLIGVLVLFRRNQNGIEADEGGTEVVATVRYRKTVGAVTALVSTAFAVGYALDQLVPAAALATLGSIAVVAMQSRAISRNP